MNSFDGVQEFFAQFHYPNAQRGAVNENVGLEIQNIQEVVGGLVLVSEHGTNLVRFMIWTWFNVMNHLFCFCNIFFFLSNKRLLLFIALHWMVMQ